MTDIRKPDALMFMSESCPHCPRVMENLVDILKNGHLASLKILNIEYHTGHAQELNVRSLPWVKIGHFELEGLQSSKELENWAKTENTEEGIAAYLVMLFESGSLQKARQFVESDSRGWDALLNLLSIPETNISVRTGASVLIEELEGTHRLKGSTLRFASMLQSAGANLRADACFFLGLTHNPEALIHLEPMLSDSSKEVREIALESMVKLNSLFEK